MESFDDLLRKFDLEYFGNGKHKISFEKMMELNKENKAFILDVRTKEENECIKLGFANNIPVNEIPDRINEIANSFIPGYVLKKLNTFKSNILKDVI